MLTGQVQESAERAESACEQPPVKVLVLGIGGGGFDREIQCILDGCDIRMDVVVVYCAPQNSRFTWKSVQPVVATYRLRSPALTGDTFWNQVSCFISNAYFAFWILLVENPQLILAVGTAQAIPFAIAARFLRRRMWFVESLTRVKAPSRTGRWMYRFGGCEKVFFYWSEMTAHYPKGILAGGDRP